LRGWLWGLEGDCSKHDGKNWEGFVAEKGRRKPPEKAPRSEEAKDERGRCNDLPSGEREGMVAKKRLGGAVFERVNDYSKQVLEVVKDHHPQGTA